MKKDYNVLLAHIAECIERIEEYTKDITKDEFSATPWKQIAGMRDILIHEYFGVDLDLTWKAAKEDILNLRKKLAGVK